MDRITEFSQTGRRSAYTRRDWAIAETLRRLLDTLRASTATAYLLKAGASSLSAAVTVDTALSFTANPGMSVHDEDNASSRAYLTGEPVIYDWPTLQRVIQRQPEALLHVPVPMAGGAVPLAAAGRRLGTLTLRWEPPEAMGEDVVPVIQRAADQLAQTLLDLERDGESLDGPDRPVFVSPDPAAAGARSAAQGPVSATPPPSGSGFLYQLGKLAAELTAADEVQDVVAATQRQVVRPFGGRALMLCAVEGERLHVLGAAGFSREAVNQVEGTRLSSRTPATDCIDQVQVLCFSTADALRRQYPRAHLDPDCRARAYLPLISRGRMLGCCLLDFAAEGPPLGAEETAVAVLMLEQVGQSLERTRAFERERALAHTVQRSLLPRRLPHLNEADATARYLPASQMTQVGGDWYDVIPLPNGGAGLVIGDVEGHALEAAGIMGQLRSAVRAYAAEGHTPATVLERSSRLFADLEPDRYATCCCVWVDLATGTACAATAGHHGPLITDGQGHTRRMDLPVGPPLGVAFDPVYENRDTTLTRGSVTTLFTDGMLDSRRLGTEAAVDRLAVLLSGEEAGNLEVLADRLVKESRPEQVFDDAALLVMRYDGPRLEGPPRVAQISVQRHDLQGVARVRRFLGERLDEWRLGALRDDLDLLATEVVTNALIHAHSEVEVRLREYPDRLRVEVRDSDPHPPVPATVLTADAADNQPAESGRGLLIVDVLAAEWGSSPAGRGKTTWFDLAVPQDSPLGETRYAATR